MSKPLYPSLYQINTRVWLTERSRTLGRPATLDDMPDAELDRLATMGFDWIWLLSVWHTGPAGQRVSRANPEWRQRVRGDPAGPARRGHRRLRLRHHRLHRASRPRRRCGAGPPARAPPDSGACGSCSTSSPTTPAWIIPGWRTTPSTTSPERSRSGPGAPELHVGEADAGRSPARPWPRPLLRRLARHLAARLRQSGHSGGDDRRAGQDRRAVRRRAL